MPQLLLAVPLRKTWFGTRYWKTPLLMDLPVELEYIPYPELEARFKKLDKIARRTYPTERPNVIALLLFGCLFVAAAIGIARSQRPGMSPSVFQIMGQSACFILPVLVILWIRLRKDSNTKARKLFKRRSQKLVRAWTSHDSVTHAMQWKLRQRSRSLVSQWTLAGLPQQEQLELDQHHHHLELRQEDERGSLEVQETGDRDLDMPSEQTAETQSGSPADADPAVTIPRRTADVYSVLRSPASASTQPLPVVLMMTPSQLQQEQHQFQPAPGLLPTSSAVTATSNLAPQPASGRASTWEPWKELFKDLSCCAYFFREPKVWVIEISIRDGVADEYALPVPSPVYRDYRLPEYDVVMGLLPTGTMATTATITTITTSTATGSLTAATPSTRYIGQPPAYESDSENDSGDEDADMDDDHDDDTHTTVESSSSSSSLSQELPSRQHLHPHQQRQAVEMTSMDGGSVIVEMTSMTTVISSTTLVSSSAIRDGKKEEQEQEAEEESESKDPESASTSFGHSGDGDGDSDGGGKRQEIEE